MSGLNSLFRPPSPLPLASDERAARDGADAAATDGDDDDDDDDDDNDDNDEDDQIGALRPARHAHTHHPGEEASRLASAARYLGLSSAAARAPAQPVRVYAAAASASAAPASVTASERSRSAASKIARSVGIIFTDTTLAAARMHSVGVTAAEERIAEDGTLHLMSVARRRKGAALPEYEDLADLFKRPPTAASRAMEVEVRETEEEEVEEVLLDSVEGGSLTAAVFGIVKGTVGPAILYLPRGFRLAGWAVAIPAMILSTTTFLYSANRLLECWKVESRRDHLRGAKMEEIRNLLEGGEAGGGYGATAAGAGGGRQQRREGQAAADADDDDDNGEFAPRLLSYPELARRAFSSAGTWFVTLGIALMQFGVCLTYLIFVPQNLTESTYSLTGTRISETYFLVAMVLIEVPLSWLRDIRKLTPLNVLATFLIAFGLASCLAIAFQSGIASAEGGGPGIVGEVAALDALNDTWYLFIGTSFFVFEGSITLLVPLQEAVYATEDREKFPALNQRATTYIVIFYIFFAMTCWAAFGDTVRTALTASLPPGSFATSVQFAYSIAVIFTFPLQAFPALEVACHSTEQKAGGSDGSFLKNTVIRNRDVTASIIVCALGVVAYLSIDYLGNVVSLLGSLVGVPIALIFPPLMHNRLVRNSTNGRRMMNYAVAGLGLFAMAAASFTTIVSWDKGAE